jgi:hypothetical protein
MDVRGNDVNKVLSSPWPLNRRAFTKSGRIIQALPYQFIRGVWFARDDDILPRFDLTNILALRPIRRVVKFAFTFDFPRLP